ncbi:MAG: HD domain-containing protein [Candidatus Accumulibacter sp.]|jgi:hypothetical protein|nr:HD domain-containing protein [Accumulibacter sp.]
MNIHLSDEVTDREAIEEFVESLSDSVSKIENSLAHLKNDPRHKETIESLYSAVRNIKDEALYYKIDLAAKLVLPIEVLLMRACNNEITFENALPDALITAFDQIELAMDDVFSGEMASSLPRLTGGLERLASSSPQHIDQCAIELIDSLGGRRLLRASNPDRRKASGAASATRSPEQRAGDLRFFHSLANLFESRSEKFKGRTLRLLRLALKTNEINNNTIDPLQLEAAIYMHDIGMMFLPERIWLKSEYMTPEEKEMLRAHPGYSAGILERIDGWSDAARMILEHHEMPDGLGYPKRLGADEICDGAKVLAIVDAFESIMLKHSQRGKNRSIMRAIAEINACNNQFAPEWIEPFNKVIRQTVEA